MQPPLICSGRAVTTCALQIRITAHILPMTLKPGSPRNAPPWMNSIICLSQNNKPSGVFMRKQYIEVPLPMKCSRIRMLLHVLAGSFMLPFYLTAAWILKTPGISAHLKIAWLAPREEFIQRRISFNQFYLFFLFSHGIDPLLRVP